MLDMFMSRARFHQLIWTMPRAVLLSKLGLRDPELLDLCGQHRIPAPPGQAWVKPRTSNQHYNARLPKRDLGESLCLLLRGDFMPEEQRAWFDEMLAETLEDIDDMTPRFRKRLAAINEHDDPFRMHDEIAGVLHIVSLAGDTPADGQRWLNLLNEIFLYAEALGGHCKFGGHGAREHMIRLGHRRVFFTLAQTGQTDWLRLEIPALGLRWEDSDAATLENILPQVMADMGVAAEMLCRMEREQWRSWQPMQSEESGPGLRRLSAG